MNPSATSEAQDIQPTFVLDNDIPLAWLLTNQGTAYTSGVMWKLMTHYALVPDIWPYHLAESIRESERRKLVDSATADRFLTRLATFRIIVDATTHPHRWTETLPLARSLTLKVVDAAYLELARRRQLPLATISPRLRRIAPTLGIPIYQP